MCPFAIVVKAARIVVDSMKYFLIIQGDRVGIETG
jgi:hypothetical protein